MTKQCYRICFVEEDCDKNSTYLMSEMSKESLEDLVAWIQFFAEKYWDDGELSLPSTALAELIVLFSDSQICDKQSRPLTIEAYRSRELRAKQWFDGDLERLNGFIEKYNGVESMEDAFHFATEEFAA